MLLKLVNKLKIKTTSFKYYSPITGAHKKQNRYVDQQHTGLSKNHKKLNRKAFATAAGAGGIWVIKGKSLAV